MIQFQEEDSSQIKQRIFFHCSAGFENEAAFFSAAERNRYIINTSWIQSPLFLGNATRTVELDVMLSTYWEELYKTFPVCLGQNKISFTNEKENVFSTKLGPWKCGAYNLGFDQYVDLLLYAPQQEEANNISSILSELTPEILQFSYKNGISGFLTIAINIARQKIRNINELWVQKEQDPETEEEWLVIQIEVSGEVDEILRDVDQYTDKIVSNIPWPYRNKIRLSFDIQ